MGPTHLCWCWAACSFQYSSSSSRDPNSGGSGSPISSLVRMESSLSWSGVQLKHGNQASSGGAEFRLEIGYFVINVTPVNGKSQIIKKHDFKQFILIFAFIRQPCESSLTIMSHIKSEFKDFDCHRPSMELTVCLVWKDNGKIGLPRTSLRIPTLHFSE